jgi:adenine-specific DNA-methyltransferase
MQKTTALDPEGRSADLVAENVERLKELFPEAFTEGQIDFDVLRQLLGGAVEEREEKYGLNWHGKRRARQFALTPSTGTLRPCPEESTDWDTTQNLMIEGDNLEVLKLMQKSYAGKVKLIYIDPPYNTGEEFVYPDDFAEGINNYLEITGQANGGGLRLTSNSEASGRFHTHWLNMMYPRLKVARNLLRDDGFIFVSIDDHETHNLRTLLNDIFGEENFVCNAVWQKAYTAKMTAKFISDTHDHIMIFAKNAVAATLGRFARTEEQKAKFKNPDNDPRGPWKAENLSAGKFYAAGQFTITGPTGQLFDPPPGRYWRCNEGQYQKWLSDNRITFGQDGDGRPMLKKFLSEVDDGLTPSSWWKHEEFGSNKEASIELKALFDGEAVFQTPKPVKLILRILELTTDDDDLVLDFFAGSGTTAHALFEANRRDSINRRFILVQLPEQLDAEDKNQKAGALFCDRIAKPGNLAELTKERLRRAKNKILSNAQMFPLDLGFRVFKLDSSNIRAWDPDRGDLSRTLLDSIEHVKPDRTEQDILYELLLKLGLELTVPIEQRTIAGKAVHSVGAGSLFVCLAPKIGREEVEPLAHGIASWREEHNPAGETEVVFRDSAFADDVAKSNLTAILQQRGIENVRSL